MVADSNWSDGVQKGSVRKVWRIRNQLIGCAGNIEESTQLLAWFRGGCKGKVPKIPTLSALVLSANGLSHLFASEVLMPVEGGIHAIGTGGVAAMAAHEALGFQDPRRAVQIVCKHDAGSYGPVRVYRI